ncbi:MAG: GldM family protein, partial [Bacteroidota bacterium]
KLSPRQKMINMMYLVLLALLAMNVSKEVLDAFENLKAKLNNSAITAEGNNIDFMTKMKEKIDEEVTNEGKKVNIGLKDTLDQIAVKTSGILKVLNDHSREMETIAGKDSLTGKLENKSETEKNYQYWMGIGDADTKNEGRGEGQAFELRNKMNDYFEYLATIYNANVKKAEDKITAKQLEDQVGLGGESKTWEKFNFDAPVVANVAILEALKLDVFEQQKQTLDLLNTRLGVAAFKVDKVLAIEAPVSTIVPAGLTYETKLYIAMSSNAIKPSFSSSSGRVETSDDGTYATLKIGASANAIKGKAKEGKQSYTANVRVPKATGGFDDLKVEGSFTVRKPEIVITSAAVQNLYRNCGNDVNIDVPALGDLYKPKINASSATVIANKTSNKKFRIVPTGKTCVVSVNSITNGQTMKIGDVNYKVIEPPKPTIDMAINGKPTSGSTPVAKSSRIQVKLNPDADFRSSLPGDANYGISSIDVLAQLSLGPPQKVNSVNTNGKDATKAIRISLGTRVRQARPGTKVYIRINEIYRKNFRGQKIPDKRFSEVERTLSIVVK